MNKPETWKDIAKITWAVTLGIPKTEALIDAELEVVCEPCSLRWFWMYHPDSDWESYTTWADTCSLRSNIASSLFRAFPDALLDELYIQQFRFELPVTPSFYIESYDLVRKVVPKAVLCQLDSYEQTVLNNINTLGVEFSHVS